MKGKYGIYFVYDNGLVGTFTVESAKRRDAVVADLIDSGCYKAVSYCRIRANGEIGLWKDVCKKA